MKKFICTCTRVFSGPYFPVLGLSTEIYVNLRIESEYRKIRTRKNSVFEHFLRSEIESVNTEHSKFEVGSGNSASTICQVHIYVLSLPVPAQTSTLTG